jgi:threonine 3-dehydrogenase
MNKPIALVTGAGGEMGRLLVPALVERGIDVVALDLGALPPELEAQCVGTARMNILDTAGVQQLMRSHQPAFVFHLAALLSSHAERDPDLAHRVNVEATLNLFSLCQRAGSEPVRFLFPSSIAVYGLPDRATKRNQRAVRETEWSLPSGMYGCNKLYCELLGSYLSRRARAGAPGGLDFRSIRFPGLISAATLPAGGTTDYAPEMIHAAAQNRAYKCFVLRDTRLPFMTMPDAVDALIRLALAEPDQLTTCVYNVRGFSSKAAEIRSEVLKHFPDAEIGFEPDPVRQALVDSWPGDVDDSLAQNDWGFSPKHGLSQAMADYLVPAMKKRYATAKQ